MRTVLAAGLLVAALAGPSPLVAQGPAPAERKLQVTFDQMGNVSVVAQNVTIQEILAEWTRQGGTVFVNANRLGGGLVTRTYANPPQPEAVVLSSLLGQAAGFIAGPRRVGTIGASRIEVVQITPTSSAAASGTYTPPSSVTSAPLTTAGNPDDELPPVVPPGANPGANQPPPTTPNNPPPPPTNYGPAGVSVPVVPVVGVPGSPTPPPAPGRGRGGTR
jgi:hypothetical protein